MKFKKLITSKIQFVFCNHSCGYLACEHDVQPQPPLGLITLSNYVNQIFPDLEIEVYDGRFFTEDELIQRLDGNVIGLSVWFSNYKNSISLASRIKQIRPNTVVVMGGPHPTWLADQILRHNECVDFIVRGEGEIPFIKLLSGTPPEEIPGVLYRRMQRIFGIEATIESWERINLDLLPTLNLGLLRPPYQWKSKRGGPAMSAFPLSGIRGCQRNKCRCEYCSIPTFGYRAMSPKKYWHQVSYLNEQYGIDYFFETGDTFSSYYLKQFGAAIKQSDMALRIYSYPSELTKSDLPYLKAAGVHTIFMGIESVLHWTGRFRRKYPKNYSLQSLINEIEMYGNMGIKIVAGFLLGLPGEDIDSLKANIRLIRQISHLPNVSEITVSVVLPLPGAEFFKCACEDPRIAAMYKKCTGENLCYADNIEYYFLSQLFVNRFTEVGYTRLFDAIINLRLEIGPRMANWGLIRPLN